LKKDLSKRAQKDGGRIGPVQAKTDWIFVTLGGVVFLLALFNLFVALDPYGAVLFVALGLLFFELSAKMTLKNRLGRQGERFLFLLAALLVVATGFLKMLAQLGLVG